MAHPAHGWVLFVLLFFLGLTGCDMNPRVDWVHSDGDSERDAERADQEPDSVAESAESEEDIEWEQSDPDLTWLPIAGGSFEMGCSSGNCKGDQWPAATVTLSSFWMTESEITQGQYWAQLGQNPSTFSELGPNYPVESVTHGEALAFCQAVGGTLPSEAQWEYAARAWNSTVYVCGDDAACLADAAWYDTICPHAVKSKAPNDFGLFDLTGNVAEWCADWYDEYIYSHLDGTTDPSGPKKEGFYRVVRGGSWETSSHDELRVSARDYWPPEQISMAIGFRCVRSSQPDGLDGDYEFDFDHDRDTNELDFDHADCDFSPELTPGFVRIAAGSFIMGSPVTETGRGANETQHAVTLTYPFEMAIYETTGREFFDLQGYLPCEHCAERVPVNDVSWYEAVNYLNALSRKKGYDECYECLGEDYTLQCWPKTRYRTPQDCAGYRLPTEAEWEYAARAGSTSAFYNGEMLVPADDCRYDDHLAQIGWYCWDKLDGPQFVGTKAPNAWGLYDLSGNVFEWAQDDADGSDYETEAVFDPVHVGGADKIIRGGGTASPASSCRSAYRNALYRDNGYSFSLKSGIGFRAVRSLP